MEQRKVIRLGELASTKNKAGKLPVSPATVWRWVRYGEFPKPFKLGERVTVWDLEEIEEFMSKKSNREVI